MPMSVTYTVVGGQILAEQRGGQVSRYLPDPLGNTVGLADTSGNITSSFDYWPYGEFKGSPGSVTTPYTFIGTLGYFRDFGCQFYVRARHYRSDLTSWMTVDPLWPKIKPYRYCNSRPVINTDPTGLKPCAPLNPNYADCYYQAIQKGITPYGACLKCTKLPFGEAYNRCKNLSAKPASSLEKGLLKFLAELTLQGVEDYCLDIATSRVGTPLQVFGALFGDITSAPVLGCKDRCEKAINDFRANHRLSDEGDYIPMNERLVGFKGCLSGVKDDVHDDKSVLNTALQGIFTGI